VIRRIEGRRRWRQPRWSLGHEAVCRSGGGSRGDLAGVGEERRQRPTVHGGGSGGRTR
jgi:hypothetical protein